MHTDRFYLGMPLVFSSEPIPSIMESLNNTWQYFKQNFFYLFLSTIAMNSKIRLVVTLMWFNHSGCFRLYPPLLFTISLTDFQIISVLLIQCYVIINPPGPTRDPPGTHPYSGIKAHVSTFCRFTAVCMPPFQSHMHDYFATLPSSGIFLL